VLFCCQYKELEARDGGMTAVTGAMENGQVHYSNDSSSIDELRAQLQEQVLLSL